MATTKRGSLFVAPFGVSVKGNSFTRAKVNGVIVDGSYREVKAAYDEGKRVYARERARAKTAAKGGAA